MATILYVDRDEAAQQFVQAALGQLHYVIIAADGPTAMQYGAIMQPDLVIMALTDGYELASRVKTLLPATPLLITLPPDFDEREAQALAAHFDGLVRPPLEAEDLRQAVQSLLPPNLSELPGMRPDDRLLRRFETQIAALNQANQRLASINAISALIGASLDLEHLTDEILAQIHKVIVFDCATLLLLKGNILEAAAMRGCTECQAALPIYRHSQDNPAWQIVTNKLPLIINAALPGELWQFPPELGPIQSWLGVPLIYKERVVGVLSLAKNEPGAFTDADARYLFTLAYQIAITVENAQLFEEWEKQSTRLKLINEVGRDISTILDVDNLFTALAWAIFDRFKYDRVAILEIDSTRSRLVVKAVCGPVPLHLKPGYQREVGAGAIGRVVKTGRTLFVNSTGADSLFTAGEAAACSELIIPIFMDNQVAAVINVDRAYPAGFGDQDLWSLSSLAAQAATTMTNARLYRQVQETSTKLERIVAARTERLQAVKQISHVVSQGLALNELLVVVGQGISQIFEGVGDSQSQVVIGLVDGGDVLLKTIYVIGTPLEADPVLRLKVEAQSSVGRVIKQAEPVILHHFSLGGSLEDDPVGPDNSVMMAPLITGGKTIGLIKVESRGANFFDESDLEILELLTFQIASAIEHARLVQRTREIAIVEERTRLAREMHDGIAQNLAYLLLQIDRSLGMVEEDSQLAAQLERAHSLLQQNIDELRRNIFDLRPVELEGKSLFAALKNFVAEFDRRWHLKTTCVISGEPPEELSPEVESALYRILQESLSNAQQYAHCHHLTVSLAIEANQWVSLVVQDDGVGFDITQAKQAAGKGLGLVFMRERAQVVGGHLTVASCPGQGTRIEVKLPLRRELK